MRVPLREKIVMYFVESYIEKANDTTFFKDDKIFYLLPKRTR